MQESKKTLYVEKHHTREFVAVAVAPGQSVQEVLAAIGERGALALATGGRHGLVFLAPATLWNGVADRQRLCVVCASDPGV